MKTFHRILSFLAAILSAGLFFGCTQTMDEIGTLELRRCLEPMNLSAKVTNGDQVTFNWDVTKDATQYNLVVYTDKEMTKEYFSTTLDPSQVPFTKALEADATYYYKVQAVSSNGLDDSNWAVYDKSIKTYAVKDNLYLKVSGRDASSVSLAWSTAVGDFEDVDRIEYRLPSSETASTYELTASD
ncbi:MAG: fibronectin type III domain-containing protein, partial [Bacteroidales bacterium]|nr:fibronectin type III domain-containing protein [Bacteroidales bacterium]